MRKKGVRAKHTPQRMCVACRTGADKRTLIRIVRNGESVQVDPSGKMAGRGAYLHAQRACWEQALDRRLLERALRTAINVEERRALAEFAETLPEGTGAPIRAE